MPNTQAQSRSKRDNIIITILTSLTAIFIILSILLFGDRKQRINTNKQDQLERDLATANAMIISHENTIKALRDTIAAFQLLNSEQLLSIQNATSEIQSYRDRLNRANTRINSIISQSRESENNIRNAAQALINRMQEAHRIELERIASERDDARNRAVTAETRAVEAERLANTYREKADLLNKTYDRARKEVILGRKAEEEALEREKGFLGIGSFVLSKELRDDKISEAIGHYRVAEGAGVLPAGFSQNREIELKRLQ